MAKRAEVILTMAFAEVFKAYDDAPPDMQTEIRVLCSIINGDSSLLPLDEAYERFAEILFAREWKQQKCLEN